MNFDYWKGELTMYEKDSVSADEGEIATFWEASNGHLVFKIDEDYELVEEDDGYNNKYHVIQKKTKEADKKSR